MLPATSDPVLLLQQPDPSPPQRHPAGPPPHDRAHTHLDCSHGSEGIEIISEVGCCFLSLTKLDGCAWQARRRAHAQHRFIESCSDKIGAGQGKEGCWR